MNYYQRNLVLTLPGLRIIILLFRCFLCRARHDRPSEVKDCEKKDSVSFFKNDIFPRYYYESFSQGFVLNREDFGNRKIIPGLAIEIGGKGDYLYGVGCNWLSTQNMVIGGQFSFTRYNIGAMADVPLQLYKSAENGFGIKFTPLIYYQYVRKTEPLLRLMLAISIPGQAYRLDTTLTKRFMLVRHICIFCIINTTKFT